LVPEAAAAGAGALLAAVLDVLLEEADVLLELLLLESELLELSFFVEL
jgi:hypothetical protein